MRATRLGIVLCSIQVVVGSNRVDAVVVMKLGVCLVDEAILSDILWLLIFLNETDIGIGGVL